MTYLVNYTYGIALCQPVTMCVKNAAYKTTQMLDRGISYLLNYIGWSIHTF